MVSNCLIDLLLNWQAGSVIRSITNAVTFSYRNFSFYSFVLNISSCQTSSQSELKKHYKSVALVFDFIKLWCHTVAGFTCLHIKRVQVTSLYQHFIRLVAHMWLPLESEKLTPHKNGPASRFDPGPSCCEAGVLTTPPPLLCIVWNRQTRIIYNMQTVQTCEESSMALWKFLNFRWHAALFEYRAGIFLLSLIARL